MVSLSAFINEYAMQSEDDQHSLDCTVLRLCDAVRNFVGLSPFDNSESADDSFFHDPSYPAILDS